MSRPPMNVDAQLEASLRRIAGALEQNRSQYAAIVEQVMARAGAEAAERIAEKAGRITSRIAEKHERREERRKRHEEWRQRREARRRASAAKEGTGDAEDVAKGVVLAVMAIICVLFAVRQPAFFWMVFVALGFGMSAASSFGRAMKRRQQARERDAEPIREAGAAAESAADEAEDLGPTPRGAGAADPVIPPIPPVPPMRAAEPSDPKVARIQGLCDKLLAELESGPAIVREVVTEPRATIGGLREACVQTARRERELRSVLAAQDEANLLAERKALSDRLSTERDAIVRDRLGQALAALDQQLAHRAELATAAARLEAENMRILYTLENLHMQLLRARSTDIGGPELGGKLRDSLRELGTEIDAVAEALEWASAPATTESAAEVARAAGSSGTTTVAPPAQPAHTPAADAAGVDRERADRERAEREAAARRAAQSREAQRH